MSVRFQILHIRKITTIAALLIILTAAPFLTSKIMKSVPAMAAKRIYPICSVQTNEKKIAFTFDTDWDDLETKSLINVLGRYNVKTTFFIVGVWADKYPQSVKNIAAAGHEIGNHSDTHPHMSKLPRGGILAQINSCNQKLESLTGINPELFRPPYNDCSTGLVESAGSCNMYCIEWNLDSFDWKNPTPRQISERVISQVKPGSIVLFHNGARNTASALPDIIDTLQSQGYSIVPVSQLIYKNGYAVNEAGEQIKISLY
ncbi:MAG TPA: polysaccharide deacetylase family protein [Caproiciproducens sp.]|nr:polysaccharide deacetylase family protein [Caproiciproducens sp.]